MLAHKNLVCEIKRPILQALLILHTHQLHLFLTLEVSSSKGPSSSSSRDLVSRSQSSCCCSPLRLTPSLLGVRFNQLLLGTGFTVTFEEDSSMFDLIRLQISRVELSRSSLKLARDELERDSTLHIVLHVPVDYVTCFTEANGGIYWDPNEEEGLAAEIAVQMEEKGFGHVSVRFLRSELRVYTGSLRWNHWVARVAEASSRSETKDSLLIHCAKPAPLEFVWDAFFQGEDGKFSIFVHSRPGFVLSDATTRSKYFLDQQVNDSIQVDWGEATMIEAERVLLRHALRDPYNHRFVFLSDSCIPLYSFRYTYNYIMSTPTSFVDSFADTKDSRYNPRMNPIIPVHNWRKGSQWVVLNRKHAEIVVNDTTVLPAFQQHCRRKSLPEFWRDRPVPAEGWKEHNCIPDEHYVQTLLAQKGVDGELTRRSLTYSAWDLSSSKGNERRGWHPMTYKFTDATLDLIKSIKGIDNINYETEYRREWCSSQGKPSPCFLFARKFTRPAALRLLRDSILLRDKGQDN